jgi:hypothetical protein
MLMNKGYEHLMAVVDDGKFKYVEHPSLKGARDHLLRARAYCKVLFSFIPF